MASNTTGVALLGSTGLVVRLISVPPSRLQIKDRLTHHVDS